MQQTEEALKTSEQKALTPRAVIVIGAASGGPAALTNIIPKLPNSFPASVVIVQHMRPGFTRLLASHLSVPSGLPVEEAEQRQPLRQRQALIAPGCHGLTIIGNTLSQHPYVVNLDDQTDSVAKARTRVDVAMTSAAEVVGPRTIGVLLTGAGSDGREGMKAIKEAGGTTLAQDQDSCLLFDMPRSAIEANAVDEVLPLWSIADRLTELMGEG